MYFLLNMGIFHCYVSLPEGIPFFTPKWFKILQKVLVKGFEVPIGWEDLGRFDGPPVFVGNLTKCSHWNCSAILKQSEIDENMNNVKLSKHSRSLVVKTLVGAVIESWDWHPPRSGLSWFFLLMWIQGYPHPHSTQQIACLLKGFNHHFHLTRLNIIKLWSHWSHLFFAWRIQTDAVIIQSSVWSWNF